MNDTLLQGEKTMTPRAALSDGSCSMCASVISVAAIIFSEFGKRIEDKLVHCGMRSHYIMECDEVT